MEEAVQWRFSAGASGGGGAKNAVLKYRVPPIFVQPPLPVFPVFIATDDTMLTWRSGARPPQIFLARTATEAICACVKVKGHHFEHLLK